MEITLLSVREQGIYLDPGISWQSSFDKIKALNKTKVGAFCA